MGLLGPLMSMFTGGNDDKKKEEEHKNVASEQHGGVSVPLF
jgi:hypothetical protein